MKAIILLVVFMFICRTGSGAELQKITGVVLDAVTKEPLEGVSIKNEETKKIVDSDHKGQFIIETDSMKIDLTAEVTGYQRISRKLAYPYREVTLEMQLSNEYMLDVVYVKDKSQIEGSKQKISKEYITKTTTHLFADSLKVVQTLPGVITGDDFSSLMYVRGGEFYETISFLDNIHILTPYVWGGNQSVFNPSFVEKVDFYSGGFPVKYFQGLSAVIDVKNREGNYQERKGFIDLSATSLESILEGPIEKDRISYIVGVRRTYYDLLLNMLYKDKADKVVFPFFYDSQAKITWKQDEKNKFYFNLLSSYEGMNFDSKAITEVDTDPAGNDFKFDYNNVKLLPAFNWERVENEKLSLKLTISLRYDQGRERYEDVKMTNFDGREREYNLTVGNRITYLSGNHTLEQGIYYFNSWNHSNISSKYRILMPDGSYYQEEENRRFDWLRASAAGIYLQDDFKVVEDKFYINFGAISEVFEATHEYTLCPRGGVKYLPKEGTTVKFNTGLYSQFPAGGGFGFPPFIENDHLRSEKALHYVFGVEQDLPQHFMLRTETYYKDYFAKVVKDPNPEYKYTNNGLRYAYGIDVFLQKKIAEKWDGWIAYGYLQSKDKISRRSNSADFTGVSELDYPQPIDKWFLNSRQRKHNLSFVLNYQINQRWKMAATYRFSTGMPYTPITGSFKGFADYVPVYGEYLSAIMPNYRRLDIKLSMPFFRVKNMESYIQIINTFNNKNIDQYYYNEDYSERHEATMLTLIPIFGLRYGF